MRPPSGLHAGHLLAAPPTVSRRGGSDAAHDAQPAVKNDNATIEAIEAMKKKGVQDVYAAISHGILSGEAMNRIKKCKSLKELVITDSIPLSKSKQISKIHAVSIAPMLAEAIKRIHDEESISCLFDEA